MVSAGVRENFIITDVVTCGRCSTRGSAFQSRSPGRVARDNRPRTITSDSVGAGVSVLCLEGVPLDAPKLRSCLSDKASHPARGRQPVRLDGESFGDRERFSLTERSVTVAVRAGAPLSPPRERNREDVSPRSRDKPAFA